MLRAHFDTDTGVVELPAFFASISSVKTSLSVSEYLQVALAAAHSEVLLSTFDLANLAASDVDKVRRLLNQAIAAKYTVLFDSGNYESYWLRNESWSQEKFHSVLARFPCSFTFSFDVRAPSAHPEILAEAILFSLEVDRKAAAGIPVVPVIHGAPTTLPETARSVVRGSTVAMIAIPERELGAGIVERATTLAAVRSKLDESNPQVAIHLLGTGNPLAIITYTMLGASSFDGLEWCQTAVDETTGSLHHLSQGELFFDDVALRGSGLSVGVFTLIKNLKFFSTWMNEVRACSRGGQINAAYAAILKQAQKISERAKR